MPKYHRCYLRAISIRYSVPFLDRDQDHLPPVEPGFVRISSNIKIDGDIVTIRILDVEAEVFYNTN